MENETRESQGWQAKLWLKSVDGRILGEASGEGRTECLSAEEALEMNLEAFVPAEEEDWEERVFVESQIKFDCGEQAKNVETLLPYKYLQLKEATVTVKVFEQEQESSFTEKIVLNRETVLSRKAVLNRRTVLNRKAVLNRRTVLNRKAMLNREKVLRLF